MSWTNWPSLSISPFFFPCLTISVICTNFLHSPGMPFSSTLPTSALTLFTFCPFLLHHDKKIYTIQFVVVIYQSLHVTRHLCKKKNFLSLKALFPVYKCTHFTKHIMLWFTGKAKVLPFLIILSPDECGLFQHTNAYWSLLLRIHWIRGCVTVLLSWKDNDLVWMFWKNVSRYTSNKHLGNLWATDIERLKRTATEKKIVAKSKTRKLWKIQFLFILSLLGTFSGKETGQWWNVENAASIST